MFNIVDYLPANLVKTEVNTLTCFYSCIYEQN